MTSSTLAQYIAANASLPADCILGYIAWFEVADGAYDGNALDALFAKHNLNPGFLPAPINPADAFEKATKAVEGLKYPVSLGTDHLGHEVRGTAEIMVREAARTDSQIQRHLIREVRDSGARKLAYDKVGELIYYRPSLDSSGRVNHSSVAIRSTLEPNLGPEEYKLLADLTTKFDASFDRHRRFHDGQKLRGVMRSYLLHLNAVLMKSSVYFVHANRGDELARLRAMTDEIDGISLTLWQLPDLDGHRREVVDAFQREAEKSFAGLVEEIQKLRAPGKKPTKAQFVKIKARYDEVMARSGEYQRTLQISQDRTGAASEVAFEALAALLEDVSS